MKIEKEKSLPASIIPSAQKRADAPERNLPERPKKKNKFTKSDSFYDEEKSAASKKETSFPDTLGGVGGPLTKPLINQKSNFRNDSDEQNKHGISNDKKNLQSRAIRRERPNDDEYELVCSDNEVIREVPVPRGGARLPDLTKPKP